MVMQRMDSPFFFFFFFCLRELIFRILAQGEQKVLYVNAYIYMDHTGLVLSLFFLVEQLIDPMTFTHSLIWNACIT